MVKRNRSRPALKVTADGTGVAAHAGTRLVADMADALGLTAGLSAAMASTRKRRSAHDPGRVLVDLALMVADGGTSLSDLKVLRDQPDLFGSVASDPTAWRVLDSIDDEAMAAINVARAAARAVAWAAGARPPTDFIVLDFDATLVTSHSEKEEAAATYKKGFGFHPLHCFVDGTNDALAAMLRPGNAGSNTAADHLDVLDAALAQLPVKTKKADPENGEWMLARADSAGCTHGFIDALRERGLEFSVGFPMDETVREAVFGERAVGSIQQVDVRRFVADMIAAGKAPGTVRNARKVLRLVLATAEGSGANRGNPCNGVRVPASPKADMVFLDPDEVERLAKAIDPSYATLIRFAAYTGLRAGEIGALRIGRLDLLRGRVLVAESVTEVDRLGLVFGEPKTYQHRSVTLPRFLREELAATLATRSVGPNDFVFPGPDGGVLHHKRFDRYRFKPALAVAGLPTSMRFHDLRHTCAALCIGLGAHPKAIQERLGHSSITVTLDRYGHLFPKLDEALTDRLDGLHRDATDEGAPGSAIVGLRGRSPSKT